MRRILFHSANDDTFEDEEGQTLSSLAAAKAQDARMASEFAGHPGCRY
jgi:hypothetical protein